VGTMTDVLCDDFMKVVFCNDYIEKKVSYEHMNFFPKVTDVKEKSHDPGSRF
jgi:hypothetical protein